MRLHHEHPELLEIFYSGDTAYWHDGETPGEDGVLESYMGRLPEVTDLQFMDVAGVGAPLFLPT